MDKKDSCVNCCVKEFCEKELGETVPKCLHKLRVVLAEVLKIQKKGLAYTISSPPHQIEELNTMFSDSIDLIQKSF